MHFCIISRILAKWAYALHILDIFFKLLSFVCIAHYKRKSMCWPNTVENDNINQKNIHNSSLIPLKNKCAATPLTSYQFSEQLHLIQDRGKMETCYHWVRSGLCHKQVISHQRKHKENHSAASLRPPLNATSTTWINKGNTEQYQPRFKCRLLFVSVDCCWADIDKFASARWNESNLK